MRGKIKIKVYLSFLVMSNQIEEKFVA